ncbi:YARHG domain-containing protein [Flavobacterium sp. Sd200]|uniref:YARHG domain-containing protein n=1 Tax=Flavobacterium sp. Sd200 TaxID=2692211 RepID=UPI001368D9F2|nr:YARHG domain-containing protein [Flavobacterium sp. Sd200]MXN91015.1 YARHG domain-containing protein [Flavobacterium sp. Sd200]
MKKALLLTSLTILLISCKEEKEVIQNKTLAYAEVGKESHKELYGIWSGNMEPVWPEGDESEYYLTDGSDQMTDGTKMVTVKINRITNDSVFGVSISGGNQRPLVGVFRSNALATTMVLNEPGDDKYDGRFELELINDSLSGKWITYKKNRGLTPIKTLKLTQKKFKYDPNAMLRADTELIDWENHKEGEIAYEEYEDPELTENNEVNPDSITTDEEPKTYIGTIYRVASDQVFVLNASKNLLTEEQLKNLTKLDMEIIRNTIFARHGYSFKRTSLRYFFESAYWYVPISNNVDKDLTKVEKQNIALLTRMEKYATDNYEHFGR